MTRAESKGRCGDEPSRLAQQEERQHKAQSALDGKTMRGTLSHEAAHQPSVHLLSLSEVQTRMVLAQRAVDSKDNESSAAPDPLTALHIRGRIYTADAMHTHKKTCRCLTYNDGAYLLIAKNNQSGLPRDLELFFADPPADRSTWRSATTCEKDHGCIDRSLYTLLNFSPGETG